MSFKLPPNISFRKERQNGYWVYNFRHTELGRIGRIVLSPTPSGQTKVDCELVGDPSDPMYRERAAIFGPLGKRIADAMHQATSNGKPIQKKYSHPVSPATHGKHIARKLMQCERCDKPIGLIILAPDAKEIGELEDYTRLMYYEMNRYKVPSWIVGALDESAGVDELGEARCIVRKVYPDRADIFYASPEEFNAATDQVRKGCC